MIDLFTLLSAFTSLGMACWLLTAMMLFWQKMLGKRLPERLHGWVRRVYLEIKPFFLYLLVLDLVADAVRRDLSAWDAILFALNVFNYYNLRNLDDDDRWKRRKAKLKEMVSVADGKLVVVPSPSR